LLRVSERGDDISGIAIEGDQRKQRVAIIRMPRQIRLENRDRIVGAPGRAR
jgi:hypothetical protein